MTMKLAGIAGIVAAMVAVTSVQAVPINGTIAMGGELNLNTSSPSTATSVSSWPLVYVVADSGSFGSISAFTMVNMSATPWVFSPQPGVALNNLWNVGGFQFDFAGDTVSQSGAFLDITGTGTMSGNGYDPTTFNWNLGLEQPVTTGPMEFTFSAAAGASAGGSPVPDGGLTVAFLGLALAGVEGLRRKLSNA
ncbi:MAG TPA: VPDSG-CTERM sorting domain-containing protein [Verrucomicrobiae bacterium]|nr:VPDSG-CTERM sorting domain-containing protein [Verrucomicrobiae bacterium]